MCFQGVHFLNVQSVSLNDETPKRHTKVSKLEEVKDCRATQQIALKLHECVVTGVCLSPVNG